MLLTSRRSFLRGATALLVAPSLIAAPAIVRGSDGVIKVWDHCACNGVTPDADNLQGVFDLARTQSKNIQFPAQKALLIEKSVIGTMSNCIVEGANCTIINGSLNQPAIVLGNSVDVFGGNHVKNLRYGQRTLLPGESVGLGNCGLLAVKQIALTLERQWTIAYPSRLYDGIKVHNLTVGSEIHGCWANAALNDGITLTFCQDLRFNRNRGDACGRTGIKIIDCQGLYGGHFGGYGNTLHAIELTSIGLDQNGDFFIDQWGGDTSGASNIMITHLRRAWIGHTWAASQLSRTVNAGSCGVELFGPYVHQVHFDTGTCCNNNGPGTAVIATEAGAPNLCSWGDGFRHGSDEFPNGVGLVGGVLVPSRKVGIWFNAMATKHTVGGTGQSVSAISDGPIQAAFAPNVVLRPNFP